MRKKVIGLLVLSGLLSIALLASRLSREKLEEPSAVFISIRDLLEAHNVLGDPDVLSVFFAEAQRTVSLAAATNGKPPGAFTRLVTVARYRQVFRYERADPLVSTRQIDLFDGYAIYHAMSVNRRLIEESKQSGDSTSEAVGLEIKTFGLLPILRQLAEPKTESVYEGRTAQGLDRLQVRTPTRVWTVYADSEHLIRRLEFRDNAIEYDDYRAVEGVRLPFGQRFYVRGKPYYELSFTKIDLKPAFPPDYFSHETLVKEIVR
jgi:hypothetical protein